MMTSMLRRALGAVKDQASIGLARVGNSNVPALEIAIVKATSHDELVVVNEKHVLEIVQIMSFSRGYASICVSLLAKRLSRTRNWVVALKVLLLIHRLLLQDSSVVDSSFDDELILVSRRMLSLSNFKDDNVKDPCAQLCTTFVRNYALYIDEWLDCFVLGAASEGNRIVHSAEGNIIVDYNDYRMDYSTYKQDDCNLFQQQDPAKAGGDSSSESDAKVAMLLNRVPVLQHLLEHVLGCSAGVEVQHPLVRSALTLILRDSFRVYADVCDGISALLNEFFLMIHKDGLKAYAIYSRLAKQAEALSQMYESCREMGICTNSEYPSVQKVSREHLVLLDDYIKDSSRRITEKGDEWSTSPDQKQKSAPQIREGVAEIEAEDVEIAPISIDEKQMQDVDLISFDKQDPLLPSNSEGGTESSWETFDQGTTVTNQTSSPPDNHSQGTPPNDGNCVQVDSVAYEPASPPIKLAEDTNIPGDSSSSHAADWEVALMDEAQKLSYSLSKGRSTSVDWHHATDSSSRSGNGTGRHQTRSRIPLLSMSAIPAAPFESLSNSREIHTKKQQQELGRFGFGSPGSYGRLMNKHPQGYKHLLVQSSR